MSSKTSGVVPRQKEPIGKTGDAWIKQRTAEILEISTISYDAKCDFRQVYQAIYKSSTFAKRWRPRKLSSEEVDALLTGAVGETAGRPTEAAKDAEAQPDCGEELSQLLSDLFKKPAGRCADSGPGFKEAYIAMLLEKSKSVERSEKKTQLSLRNDALRRASATVRANQRMVKS